MNYFLTQEGLIPTGMDASALMQHLNNTDERNISPNFRKNFTETIEHPNLLFVKKGTVFLELTKNYAWREHEHPKGMGSDERLAHAAAQNIVYLIAQIGFFTFSPKVFTMELYTLDSTNINAQMRRISIDNIMGNL